ncbi:CHAP domain-containing protein [Parapedobacter tibetensis]|uniref:CHAP domain-containing protein n=1 Tax=Parapedobacter tibetensis TaxID=2972951 RepID=UPI00214DC3AA|nr:CHAP domain-containing protein [Parapedobacter tibetensis]
MRKIYTTEIGVREATGNNDGDRVAEYLRYCGLGEGYSWCAAFVSWCFGQAGYAEPRNPWSPALFPHQRVVWRSSAVTASKRAGNVHKSEAVYATDRMVSFGAASRSARTAHRLPRDVRPGDIFGVYYANLKRIAHVGFVDEWGDTYMVTVEGNSDNAVQRKRRPISSIHAVARWIE